MDMTQALNAQLAIIMFLLLAPTLGAMQARRMRSRKIRVFMPEQRKSHGQNRKTAAPNR